MTDGSGKLGELEARLATLAAQVRSELPERARALREASDGLERDEAQARATIKRLAHMVRGSAGSHGMTRVTEPAGRVETLAPTATPSDLRALVRVLAELLDASAREAPAAAPAPAPAPVAASTGLVKPLTGRRVIAIDDDVATRRLLQMTLANLGGATVAIAETPTTFFAALEAATFDAVIVDAMMPEMNGLACLERIAGTPLAREGTRYFVLSAAAPEELRWVLPPALNVAWLRKPFRPRDLLDALKNALAP